MSKLAALLVDAWYTKTPWLWLLAPLSLLYWLVISLRRYGYLSGLFKRYRSPALVIVVGNITVGGTGKTPLVIALAQWLSAAGYSPGIVSRGYGAAPPGTPFLVTAEQSPRTCGDEPLLLARRTGLPVVIDPDRPSACRLLTEQHSCDVIIADDGLQHYAMERDIEIVVLDGARGLGNGKLLPMGPLREPASRLKTVDAIVVNGEPDGMAVPGYRHTTAFTPMRITADTLVALHNGQVLEPHQWQGEKTVHAVAGIGNPRRFFTTLESLGFAVISHVFPDHHVFSTADLVFDDGLPVIMTEKDAVKCRHLVKTDDYWFLRISAGLPEAFFDTICLRMKQHQLA